VSKQFLESIGVQNNADISVAGNRFIDCVKEYILHVRKNPHEDKARIAKEENEIRALYKSFFPYSVRWATAARQKYIKKPNHPDAERLKEKGSGATDDMQKNIIDFAICYMTIARCIGVVNLEFEKTPNLGEKDVNWSAETGPMIAKNRKKRALLLERNEVLKEAAALLEPVISKRTAMESAAADLFGRDQSEKLLTTFRSGLRTGDFNKARSGLKKLEKEKTKFGADKKKGYATINAEGEAYIAYIEKNKDTLEGIDQKLYLKPTEIYLAIENNQKEIEQAEAFLKKYYRPFLKHQIKTLQHLRTKLLVAGSLESLMTLYIRMLRGIAEPLEDIKAVRQYESEVIEHVLYLLGGQFQEMKNINRRIEEVMLDVASSVSDHEEIK
jgi:hypothetical protein